jgi:hypothetical protein
MYGGQAVGTQDPIQDIMGSIQSAGQTHTPITPPIGVNPSLPTNVSGEVPSKEAYSAGFVWGSTGTPQGYAQRPMGMKTKTEGSTMDIVSDTTDTIPEIKPTESNTNIQGSDNIAGESPSKPAYGARFVWGSSKNPQGYDQRPKGMITKTEGSTSATTPNETYNSPFNFFGMNTTAKARRNSGVMLLNPKDVPEEMFLHPLLQENKSMNGIRKNLHIGSEKAEKLVFEEIKDCERNNLAALATAMHTMNPFIYKVDGGYRIEYMCPDSLSQLEGVEVPFGLWHNLDNEESSILPDWQVIGSYTVKSIDGQKDLSEIHYNDDWEEKAVQIIDRLKQTKYYQDLKVKDWLDHYIENVKKGLHGDISTGIVTDVVYNKEKKKWIQKNIKLKSVSAVPMGNCTSPYCSTKDLPTV